MEWLATALLGLSPALCSVSCTALGLQEAAGEEEDVATGELFELEKALDAAGVPWLHGRVLPLGDGD